MTAIRAVLWDMDGTLVDSEPVHRSTLARVLSEAGFPVDDDYGNRFLGISLDETYGALVETFGLQDDLASFSAKLYRAYLDEARLLTPRPGALEVWHRLEQAGVPQAVVSNADRIIVGANMSAIGLDRPGRISVSINDVVAGKPAPEPYLRAAYLLGVPAEDCLVIEDSAIGALSGIRAGMTVLGWPEHDGVVFPETLHKVIHGQLDQYIFNLLNIKLPTNEADTIYSSSKSSIY